MSKIKIRDNNMAMFMVCEAIGEERKEFADIKPDDDGCYDIKITLNGRELNVDRFLNSLQASYSNAVKERGASLLSSEYDTMLKSIHEIQEALEHHREIFDE